MTLENEIKQLEDTLQAKKNQLAEMYKLCQHEWGEIKYDPIVEEGYTIPGDPVGTMGSDWRPACYVDRKITKRWKRICKICGKTQETTYTEKKKQNGQIPGTINEVEMPVFN